MADQGSALVVWGSTGRRLQFSMQDLKMPEKLRDDPHFHFYEKQWDSVASFWFNRVLKESSLQHLEVGRIVELIQKDIAKRWEKRRQEQSLHKKCKRLLQGSGSAGTPSNTVLLTNVVSLETYRAAAEEERKELVVAVIERVQNVAKDAVSSWRVLVDDTAPPVETTEGEPAAKRGRTDVNGHDATTITTGNNTTTTGAADFGSKKASAKGETAPTFDDRVAVICTLSSKEKAALAIAHLHGGIFDGRSVLSRFWDSS